MSTIHEQKRQEVLDTPVLLFDCTLVDGGVERWATHRVTAGGESYEPRVLAHGGFEMKLAGEDAVDAGSRFTLTLANVDRRMSQLDSSVGWKGAKLRVRFGFFNARTGVAVSDLTAVFVGVANPADELTEREARLSFTNRLSLQRVQVPGLRIQNRCPWRFPSTGEERQEAVNGGEKGEYSALYKCGYSADIDGGTGNLNGGQPFTTCNRTREECAARGMMRKDSQNNPTARFGGFAYLPPSVTVRAHGEKSTSTSEALDGRARANDAVPLVYGTAWLQAPLIFARNDGNLTHCEALIGSGRIEGVLRVLANGVELPLGEHGKDMTATGWYNVLSLGERNGGENLTFLDAEGQPAGDPHGSMACLAVVLPNSIVTQGRLPKVEVLVDGLRLARYAADGNWLGESFTRNPAWVLLDLLRRAGWEMGEINLASFAAAADYCDEFIDITTPEGQTVEGPRMEVNLALTKRRSLVEVVRGIRASAGLMVTVDEEGKVMASAETTMERQCAEKRVSSNSAQGLNGGWPAYEFGDGLNGFSAILRRSGGASTFKIWRRASSETPNRLSVEFQDSFNQYQQGSLSLVDYEDAAAQGCEVSAPSAAVGLPHADQAARVLRLQIEKNLRGNHFVEFETSVQALGLRPGDLIAISHAKEGLNRAPYRILKLSPSVNYERARIVAQRHDDEWYAAAAGDGLGSGLNDGESGGGIPRPLAGRILDANGDEAFEITELTGGAGESAENVELQVRYQPPGRPAMNAPAPPVVSLTPKLKAGAGTLAGGRTLYYAVSAVDGAGNESPLSYSVRATLPGSGGAYAVELTGIRTGAATATMRIYRGTAPGRMRRIAADIAVAASFTDAGLEAGLAPAPDGNFDHARFQWRFEYVPETAAGIVGAAEIGNSGLGLLAGEFNGSVVRILRGRGAGQERVIESHNETTLTVTPAWTLAPDATSYFAVAETGWKPAGVTSTDEIRLMVPNRPQQVVQISGVASSASGAESGAQEALLTRHRVSGSYAGGDSDVPPAPGFGLSVAGDGVVEIGGIGFATLENTNTITSGTLTLHYWDELDSPTQNAVVTEIDAEATQLVVDPASTAEPGDLLQLGAELVRVLEVSEAGASLAVERAVHETVAATHAAGSAVYKLQRRVVVLPFVKWFFGSPASGSYLQRVELPAARVAAAELYVTNERGSSPTTAQAYVATVSGGLRTLSGGQYCMQYEGELAVMATLAPPLVVEARHAVRDVRAYVGVAPIGEPVTLRLWVNEEAYCTLTIAAGSKVSNIVDGFGKKALAEGGILRAEVQSVGTAGSSYPGRNLTITVRL